MLDHMIDFDMDPVAFEHDPNVQMFIDTLNMMVPSGPMPMMVSIEDARAHLRDVMVNMMSGGSGMMEGETGMMDDDTDIVPGGTDMMENDTDMIASGNGMMN